MKRSRAHAVVLVDVANAWLGEHAEIAAGANGLDDLAAARLLSRATLRCGAR